MGPSQPGKHLQSARQVEVAVASRVDNTIAGKRDAFPGLDISKFTKNLVG
jgi:hypothetical protein